MENILSFQENILNLSNNDVNLKFFTIDIKSDKKNILEELIEFIKNNPKDLVLLDTNPNKKSYTIIEKFVYELGLFHLKRLHLTDNFLSNSQDKYYIEFWFKYESEFKSDNQIIHQFHVDKDEELFTKNNILKCPILSTLTYLSDSLYPLVISNIKYNDLAYKNKIISKKKELTLVFPKKLKHICFDCKFFHGVVDLEPDNFIYNNLDNERIVLVFNIWKNYIPIERNYFLSNNLESKLYLREQNILSIILHNNYKILNTKIPNIKMSKYIIELISDYHDKYFYKKNINLELVYKNEIINILSD